MHDGFRYPSIQSSNDRVRVHTSLVIMLFHRVHESLYTLHVTVPRGIQLGDVFSKTPPDDVETVTRTRPRVSRQPQTLRTVRHPQQRVVAFRVVFPVILNEERVRRVQYLDADAECLKKQPRCVEALRQRLRYLPGDVPEGRHFVDGVSKACFVLEGEVFVSRVRARVMVH